MLHRAQPPATLSIPAPDRNATVCLVHLCAMQCGDSRTGKPIKDQKVQCNRTRLNSPDILAHH